MLFPFRQSDCYSGQSGCYLEQIEYLLPTWNGDERDESGAIGTERLERHQLPRADDGRRVEDGVRQRTAQNFSVRRLLIRNDPVQLKTGHC